MPDHRLLHRLVSGRFWIGLIAFALLGIVAMQLSLLKLNTGIGRALEHEALLQRENASLRVQVSNLSGADRVEQQAAKMGMVSAAPGAIHFLTPGPGDASRAASAAEATASGSAPSGSAPSGSAPASASITSGSVPSGTAPVSAPVGSTVTGSAQSGSAPASAPVTSGTALSGTAPTSAPVASGSAPSGSAPPASVAPAPAAGG